MIGGKAGAVTLQAAIGELLRPQQLRVHYLPGLPAEYYTATAPCLLAQLADAIGVGSERAGGHGAEGSRALISAEAWDLWAEVHADVHGWAAYLHIDRSPYVGDLSQKVRLAVDRQPEWTHRLAPYLHADADDAAPATAPPPAKPPLFAVNLDDQGPFAATTIPPLGYLVRAVAAQAVAANEQAIADRLERRAGQWAVRIRALLAASPADERVYPVPGAACPACDAEVVMEERPGDGTYRVPALIVRFLPIEGGDPDDLWPYRQCRARACGEEGWVEYTTETPADEAA
jgi:hypothetical protein